MVGLLSVVVDDFDVVRIPVTPDEADAPLVVDADAVLALPAPRQPLETVRRREPQVVDAVGIVQHAELPECHGLDVAGKLPR